MAKVDLKIKSTAPTAQSQTTTISYVNPELTNAQLSTLAHNLNALTDNVYDSSQKVTTVNVDSEGGGGQTKPTFYLTADGGTDSITATTIQNGTNNLFDVHYNGDADVFVSTKANPTDTTGFVAEQLNNTTFNVKASSTFAGKTSTVRFFVPETDNYLSAEFEVAFTVS